MNLCKWFQMSTFVNIFIASLKLGKAFSTAVWGLNISTRKYNVFFFWKSIENFSIDIMTNINSFSYTNSWCLDKFFQSMSMDQSSSFPAAHLLSVLSCVCPPLHSYLPSTLASSFTCTGTRVFRRKKARWHNMVADGWSFPTNKQCVLQSEPVLQICGNITLNYTFQPSRVKYSERSNSTVQWLVSRVFTKFHFSA